VTQVETVTSEDGTRVAFDRVGQGPALVLVGGAIQYRAIDRGTGRLAELLGAGLNVYHYDRRGRGDSGDTAPYSVDREIEDLDALIREAGGSALVFGMSSGAVLALDAAARTTAITKLALYEPPLMVDDTRTPIPDGYTERLNELLASSQRGDALELFMTEAVGVSAETIASMRGAPFWPALEAAAHTLPYDNAIMEGLVSGLPPPVGRWAAVTVPTLVIDGGASPEWARNAVAALADSLTDARRVTLEGQTHQYDPELLAPVLREFFAA
jgi:pimeloyl-ACP methyl ester carboxylesterase